MTCHSIEPGDQLFVIGYGFLSFAKNIGKVTCKDLDSKYSLGMLITRLKLLNHAKPV